MSTLMLISASGAKMRDTVPGVSGTAVNVTLASFLSCAMPVISWLSTISPNSSSLTIIVPGRVSAVAELLGSSKLEST